jgi:pilus assembly protein CpaC
MTATARRAAGVLVTAAIALSSAAAIVAGGVDRGGAPAQVPAVESAAQPAVETISLVAGRSTVLATSFDVVRLAITDPAVADAAVVMPREVLIDGKAPGTVSLIIWGAGERRQFDVVVSPSRNTLQRQLQALFPNETITVSVSDEAVVLSGEVSHQDVVVRAGEIAQAASSKSKVINLLRVPAVTAPSNQQVMLQVRFAEVDRQALRDVGASLFAGRANFDARTTTQQFPAPTFQPGDTGEPDQLVFNDFLNLFYFSRTTGLGVVIRALQSRGHFQSLAEPNLIAYNGQEASFLAGGEFPVPVAQGSGNATTVSIEWKEFGVRLKFTPTITGDTIRLKVSPEVSTLDFANGLVLSGFRIPALSTRRAATDVELRDGQSFAIAGLLANEAQESASKVPWLGDIPIVGTLFRSKGRTARQTELLVLITPRLVRPLEAAELPSLPLDPARFLPPSDVIRQMPGGAGSVDAPLPTSEPAPPRRNGGRR